MAKATDNFGMNKKSHFIVVSGKKEQLDEVLQFVETFTAAQLNNYTNHELLNENTLILMYPEKSPPRLEHIRLLSRDFKGLSIIACESSEVLLFVEGTVRSV